MVIKITENDKIVDHKLVLKMHMILSNIVKCVHVFLITMKTIGLPHHPCPLYLSFLFCISVLKTVARMVFVAQ